MSKNTEYLRSPCYGITVSRSKPSGNIWAWKVTISRPGGKVYRDFSFIQYGGRDTALLVAQAYRDEIIRSYPPLTKRQLCTKLRSTNSSGIAGVKRVQRSENYAFWEAVTSLPDRNLTKKFSVNVYGEEGARQKAIEERQRQLACVENAYYLHSLEARELYANLGEEPEDAPISAAGTKPPSRRKKPSSSPG